MACGGCNGQENSPTTTPSGNDLGFLNQSSGFCFSCASFWILIAVLVILLLAKNKDNG